MAYEPTPCLQIIGPPTTLTGLAISVTAIIGNKLVGLLFGNNWIQESPVSFYSNTPPSAAELNDEVSIFYLGTDAQATTPDIRYLTCTNTSNGLSWSDVQIMTDCQSVTAPSAVAFNEQIYVFYQGLNLDDIAEYKPGGQLYYSYPNAGAYWQVGADGLMQGNPSAAVLDGEIYVLYQTASGSLGFANSSSVPGGSWTTGIWANIITESSPGSVTFTDSSGNEWLYVFYQNDGNFLSYTSLSSTGVTAPGKPIAPEGQSLPMSSTQPFAVVAYGSMYVFYEPPIGGLWYTSSTDGTTWSVPVGVAPTSLFGFPGIATDDSQIYCAMNSNGALWTTSLTPDSSVLGTSGRGMTSVPNMNSPSDFLGMSASPAALYINDTLISLYLSGNDMFAVSGNATNGWNGNVLVLNGGVASGSSPGAVVFNGLLYCFYQAAVNNELWYTTSVDTGTTWSNPIQVDNVGLWAGPSAVANGEILYVFHSSSKNDGDLWLSTMDTAGSWTADTNVSSIMAPDQTYTSDNSPAAFVFEDQIYVALVPKNNGQIVVVPYPNTDPASSYAVINIGQNPATSVGVTVFAGRIYIFYGDGTHLYYVSSADPLNSASWGSPVNVFFPSPPTVGPSTVQSMSNDAWGCGLTAAANGF
ncbi:hypothetical protein [Pseudomonas sp. NPDC086251]|uniref:hypothetical protein n=1 Tax=Pseudomonas sp. NPDC086251 TaxID=3364431 RepID=UPI003835E008